AAQSPPRSLPARPPAAILPRCHSSSHQSQTRNPPRFFRFHPTRLVKPFRIHGIGRLVRSLGRRAGAWEEASLGDGLDAADCYLVAWRTSGIALAQQGYDVVLAPGDACYLDMAQSDAWWEPGMDWAGTVATERCYGYDPGAGWPAALAPRLIGVQACLWSEHLHDRRLFDYLAVPRLSAIAESAWTEPAAKDVLRFMALHGLMPRPEIR